MQKNLNHDQSGGFKAERDALAQEPSENKVKFAIGGDATSKRDHGDDSNQTHVGFLNLEGKRNEEDDHRVKCLEHLNKGDTQTA